LPLHEQIELDSMDHLHFLVALKQRLGVDVPEAQYRHMRKLDDLVAYLRPARTQADRR
jgi:acyl carrier protein